MAKSTLRLAHFPHAFGSATVSMDVYVWDMAWLVYVCVCWAVAWRVWHTHVWCAHEWRKGAEAKEHVGTSGVWG